MSDERLAEIGQEAKGLEAGALLERLLELKLVRGAPDRSILPALRYRLASRLSRRRVSRGETMRSTDGARRCIDVTGGVAALVISSKQSVITLLETDRDNDCVERVESESIDERGTTS